ncbi:MAG TPA: hypothetical protein VK509_14075 [Polyangiales bacterium]|nr:hypothetical protein [Polyangiales bacterium]
MNHRLASLIAAPYLLFACSDSAPDDPNASGAAGAGGAGSSAASAGATAMPAGGSAAGGASGAANPMAGGGSGMSAAGRGGAGGGGTTGSAAGGSSGRGGANGGASGGGGMAGAGGNGGDGGEQSEELKKFSFFLTSSGSMKALAQKFGVGDQGFGGDLRYGEATGLAGADKICREVAELGMPGAGAKEWHAFLSATAGGAGGAPIHAKDRIGAGPWYDALGRLLAANLPDLIGSNRPKGADPLIVNDLPNEFGIPNHSDGAPGCSGSSCPDNHQVMTGTNCKGMLYTGGGQVQGQNEITSDCTGANPPMNAPKPEYTCNDWTSKAPEGKPWCGHSWPRQGSGLSWMSAARDGGCAPCIDVSEAGGGVDAMCVGSAGGYGGIYCFAINKP